MKRLASNRDRRLQPAPAKAPPTEPAARPATPPWVPEGAAYEMLSPRAKAMIAEILEPAYEQLVLRARDALEKITGMTIVHLVWQEILDQMDMAREYETIDGVLNIVNPDRGGVLNRHLQLIHTKLKAANYLMRVRDFRRGLLRTLHEAKAERLAVPNSVQIGASRQTSQVSQTSEVSGDRPSNAGPSGDASPPARQA